MIPELSFERRGADLSGAPLVLLHAFPLDRSLWAGVADRLDGVLALLLVDLPGLGASPLPAAGHQAGAGAGASLDVSADAVAALLDRLGHRQAVLAGVSMGGYVALAFARRYRQRVAGLALIDTKAAADPPEARENRERIARAVLGEAGPRALAPMLDGLLGASTRARRPELVDWVRERLAAAPVAGVAWSQRAMAARPDATDLLRDLRVPVAVVVGEEDVLTPPAQARAMAATAADALLTVLPAVGHLSPLEAPDAVAAAVLALMLRVRPRAAAGA